MDPFGNAAVFNVILKDRKPRQRTKIILRECVFALIVLVLFLLAGNAILSFLGLSQPSLSLSGGILLFIISIRLVFPGSSSGPEEAVQDTLIVPMAVPLIAGPSAIAMVLLISSSDVGGFAEDIVAVAIAWLGVTAILAVSPQIVERLGKAGTRAMERLTGMLLVMIATQMFLDGLSQYVRDTFPSVGKPVIEKTSDEPVHGRAKIFLSRRRGRDGGGSRTDESAFRLALQRYFCHRGHRDHRGRQRLELVERQRRLPFDRFASFSVSSVISVADSSVVVLGIAGRSREAVRRPEGRSTVNGFRSPQRRSISHRRGRSTAASRGGRALCG
jgi:multiple antibiotic resistance protein